MPLLAAGLALGAPRPAAAATPCTNQSLTGVIKDSIVVTTNAYCFLNGATVRGGVTVEAGGSFQAGKSEIRGAVSGAQIDYINIVSGVIRGGVTIAGASLTATVFDAEVRGDVTFTGIGGDGYAYLGNSTVRGSVTVNDNNFACVYGSSIEVDLVCASNTIGVTNSGIPNDVGGTKSGQCANL